MIFDSRSLEYGRLFNYVYDQFVYKRLENSTMIVPRFHIADIGGVQLGAGHPGGDCALWAGDPKTGLRWIIKFDPSRATPAYSAHKPRERVLRTLVCRGEHCGIMDGESKWIWGQYEYNFTTLNDFELAFDHDWIKLRLFDHIWKDYDFAPRKH